MLLSEFLTVEQLAKTFNVSKAVVSRWQDDVPMPALRDRSVDGQTTCSADKEGDRMILLRLIPLILALGLFVGCGSHYWQAPGRSVTDFGTDSRQCIQEATSKYDVSEKIYRRCMRAQGWERVQTNYPTDRQFRGPEDEEDFFSPPDPLSARGPALQRPADDPSCNVSTASKPAHCRR